MRIRTIKPEFWQSESVGRLSRDARLLFIALWSFADDSGRGRGAFPAISGQLFPFDEGALKSLPAWFAELEAEGMVRRYQIDGTWFFDIPKWLQHQKIEKASKSRLPPFPESSPNTPRPFEKNPPLDLGPRTMDLGPRNVDQEPRARTDCADLFSSGPTSNKPNTEPQNDEALWRYENHLWPWAQEIKKVNGKIGPKNWTAWKNLHDGLFKGDTGSMAKFIESIAPEKRWPDHVEEQYGKRRPDAVAERSGRKVHIL
jgi:hypothetical protein